MTRIEAGAGLAIGIDIDDVLVPWYETAHHISERAGITNGRTPSSWAPFKEYGCTDQEWYDVLAVATLDGTLYGAGPYEGARDALHRLKDAGHTIHLVTARGFLQHGDLIREQTVKWIAEWAIPHDTLTFSKRKAVVNVDVFVDDSEKNVRELEAAGIPAVLISQPHNAHVDWPWRVDSITEFVEEVLV